MHRYAEGTLGNVGKNTGIPYTNQYLSCIAMPRDPSDMLQKTIGIPHKIKLIHASLCWGIPRKCWKASGIPYKNQYCSCIAMPRAPSECWKTIGMTYKINMFHASPCRGIPLKCWNNIGIPYENQYCSCIAMPRKPSEMLTNHRNSW